MRVIPIEDAGDPRLDDYLKLRDGRLRRLLETERGLYIAEGSKVIRRAVEAGHVARSLLLAQRWLAELGDVIDPLDVDVFVVSEELAEQITGFHVHRGALASMNRPAALPPAEILKVQRVVVLQDLVDHTNVGAVIRNAAGLGWDGLLLSPGCADPLYRRAVKVSMGTVFSLPWARLPHGRSPVVMLGEAGFTTVALALGERSVPLPRVASTLRGLRRVALLLGTEGTGLSADWLAGVDHLVEIPMSAGVDSLNVAAASAIGCYQLGPVASG